MKHHAFSYRHILKVNHILVSFLLEMTSPRESYHGEIVTTVVLMHKDIGMYEKE